MPYILSANFFNRPADIVAKELLGCMLCVRHHGIEERHVIHETEAYMGPHDLACHASKGRTVRTETLFLESGTIYVYLIYGIYDMLNIVTGSKGYPAAVLIRSAGPYNGPGKLTRALNITRALNGTSLGMKTGVWIEYGERPVSMKRIERTSRIGVSYAKEWAHKKLRFVLT